MFCVYGRQMRSRLLVGSAGYPSPLILRQAIETARPAGVTVSLRRENPKSRSGQTFWESLRTPEVLVLPNTSGCYSASEAVATAQMAREIFGTGWIKLEVIGRHDNLCPDVFALVDAAKNLAAEGFAVFPYTNTDPVAAERLLAAGCRVLMPWCAPIGSAQGPRDMAALAELRRCFPEIPMIVDAGLGVPSHAVAMLEIGYDAVLVNTAIAQAIDPVGMAQAFAGAVEIGNRAYRSGPVRPRDAALPSSPIAGKAALG